MNIRETLLVENTIIIKFLEEQTRRVLRNEWEPNEDTRIVQGQIDRALRLFEWTRLHLSLDIEELREVNRVLRQWLKDMSSYTPYYIYASARSHSHTNTGWTFVYGAQRTWHKLDRFLEATLE